MRKGRDFFVVPIAYGANGVAVAVVTHIVQFTPDKNQGGVVLQGVGQRDVVHRLVIRQGIAFDGGFGHRIVVQGVAV